MCNEMKKFILFLFMLALPFAADAQGQQLRFGYFSYQEVFQSMPDYAIAKRNIDDLSVKYDAETKRTEDEFNKKYEDFLDGQRDFAPSIRNKRQAELVELMEKNVAFKEEAKRLMAQATADAYAPLKAKLKAALQKIGRDRGYAFIINTDNDAAPYVDSTMGEDISTMLKDALNK